MLDQVIGYFSPKTALHRKRYRMAAQHYDAAGKTYRQKGWKAPGGDANATNKGSLRILRRRSRDFVRNNAIARRAVSAIVNNVIGDGITPHVESEDKGLDREVQDLLNEHCMTTRIDAAGRNNLAGLQRLLLRSTIEGGETFLLRRSRRPRDGLPLNVQVEALEAEYLDDRFQGAMPNGNNEWDGIQYDLLNRIIAYRLYESHPEAYFGGYPTSRLVSANNVIHLFQTDRIEQRRGVPWLAPVLTLIADAYDYADAQLLRQKIAAMFVAFTRDVGPDGGDINDPNGTSADMVDDLVPGMFEHLPFGREVTFSNPPKAEGYSEHVSSVLHMIAAGLDITYESLSMELSEVNFSSARMGRIEMNRAMEAHQHCLVIPQLCLPLEGWLRREIDTEIGRNRDYKIKWTPPQFELVDPAREVPPMLESIRGGLTSRSRVIRSRGADPDEIDEERKRDKEREAKMGLEEESEQDESADSPE